MATGEAPSTGEAMPMVRERRGAAEVARRFWAFLSAARRRLALVGLLAALAMAALAALPLLMTPGLVNTRAGGDSPFLLQRVFELQANLRAGVVPARWMPDAAYGLGYPFFSYYAALPYYLAAGLSLAGAGILWGIKLTQLLGFLAAAAAIYALVVDLANDPWAGFLAAAAYTFAPFHMANVYVRGDSLSEFYAFAGYALILWGVVRLRRAPTVGHVALLATAYGGLMVTHTISAMIFSPLAGLAVIWAAATAPRLRLRVLLAGVGAMLLGAALTAWYWAPALLERDAVSLTGMTTGYFSYTGHFRGSELIQRALLFDYRIDGQHTPFVMGGLQTALAAAGLVVIVASWARERRLRWADLCLVPLLVYGIWPITPSSAALWARVPLLPMAQFPWRFLSIAALGTALAAGVAVSRLGRLKCLAAPLALGVAASALALLTVEPLVVREPDITAERLQLYEQITGNIGSTVRAEYLPGAAIPRPYTSASLLSGQARPAPVAAEGRLGEAQLLAAGPTQQTWEVTVDSEEARLSFQTYAFPGWRATIDGQPSAIDMLSANGRIALQVAQGRHRIDLRLERTPLQAAAEQASLVAGILALGLVVAGLWRARRQWRRLVLAAAIVTATVGSAWLLGIASGRAAPAAGLLTETMDSIRSPYLHANPRGVAFGESARLLGYELAARQAAAGDRLQVRLHWQVGTDAPLEALVRLTSAAEPVFHAPSLASSQAPLAAVTEHTLTVPAEVAPGLAFLAVEVHGPGGPLQPQTDQGESQGTPYLTPVRVSPPAPAPDVPPIDHLGDLVDVLAASAQEAGGALLVHLTWRASAVLPEDYITSLRLLDPTGRPVRGAELDVQPRYGLYPTSLWVPGQPVADLYRLRLPKGTPPGEGYQVEVTLYQARTTKSLGAVRIPDVTLSQPTIAPQAWILHAFPSGLALAAWQVQRLEVQDGEEVQAWVQWTALSTPLPDAVARLSLRSGDGHEVAAKEQPLSAYYPSSRWPQHALVNSRVGVRVPPGTPAGQYRLELQLLADGRDLGRWSPAEVIRVVAAERNTTLPAFAHPLGAEFGGLIRLPGYDLQKSPDQITITFHWQALRAPGRDYKVFLHCYDPADDTMVSQRDAMPRGDTYPTSRWAAGEVVSDQLVLDMSDVPAGRYQLAVGWYDPATSERLEPVGGSAAVSDRRIMLAQVDWP